MTALWITDAPKKKCESCGKPTHGHEVLFADGARFEICGECLPPTSVSPSR